jgi:hypothetical protein
VDVGVDVDETTRLAQTRRGKRIAQNNISSVTRTLSPLLYHEQAMLPENPLPCIQPRALIDVGDEPLSNSATLVVKV